MNKCFINPYVYPGIRLADLPKEYRTVIKKRGRQYNQTIISDAILKVMEVPFKDIEHKTRRKTIVDARKIYCYQMKDKLGWSLKDIGISIGNRDHTTVVHNIQTYRDLYETDDTFKDWADRIEEDINTNSADLIIKP
jgi:chromosomal replication initiator protein